MVTKGYRVAEQAPLSLKDSSITFQQISTRKEYMKQVLSSLLQYKEKNT